MVGEYCRKKYLFYILYVLFKNNNNDVASFEEVNKKSKTSVIYVYIYKRRVYSLSKERCSFSIYIEKK